jgi:hypothetical protein
MESESTFYMCIAESESTRYMECPHKITQPVV